MLIKWPRTSQKLNRFSKSAPTKVLTLVYTCWFEGVGAAMEEEIKDKTETRVALDPRKSDEEGMLGCVKEWL